MAVTKWHKSCLKGIKQLISTIMKELIKQYETAKKKALQFMQNGQLHAYFDALIEMNNYKKQLMLIRAN